MMVAMDTNALASGAELERLRAIEKAAKELFPEFLHGASDIVTDGCECAPCYRERALARVRGMSVPQSPRCLFTKLAEALGVALASGAESEQGK